MSNRSVNLQALAEAAVMVALAALLCQIKIFSMPNLGSVTAASMVPILLIALRRGTRWGVMAGVVLGLVNFMLDFGAAKGLHPVSLLLDYPIAFGMLGLAGLAAGKGPYLAGPLSTLALAGRFVAHLVSGAIFFASYAPAGQNPWVYSAIYNASYMVPEMIISGVVLLILHPVLLKAVPPRPVAGRAA